MKIASLYRTSIVKKVVVALTGIILIAYSRVIGQVDSQLPRRHSGKLALSKISMVTQSLGGGAYSFLVFRVFATSKRAGASFK